MDDWQTTLNNHTKLLNAIRKDHLDQRAILADHGTRLTRVEAGLADVRSEMRDGFGKLAKGQELITDLLTKQLDESDEATRAGEVE